LSIFWLDIGLLSLTDPERDGQSEIFVYLLT